MLHLNRRQMISRKKDRLTMRSWKLQFCTWKNKSISLSLLPPGVFFFSLTRDKIWQSKNISSWPCGTWPRLAFLLSHFLFLNVKKKKKMCSVINFNKSPLLCLPIWNRKFACCLPASVPETSTGQTGRHWDPKDKPGSYSGPAVQRGVAVMRPHQNHQA